MIFKYLSLPVFIVSLALGIFFVYAYGTDMKVIYVYPTPENVNQILFKDKADNCFNYEPELVECPKDISKIKSVPIQ
jgi:hypothetical protein